MNLITTIAAGDSIDYGHITIPRFYDYARRCGADLQVITQPVFGEVFDATHGKTGNPSWWKLPLLKWFACQTLYSRLGFIDVDVYVTARAASFFEFDQSPGFYMARDMNDAREFPLWKEWAKTHYPDFHVSMEPPGYFNSGVWTVDRETAGLMVAAMEPLGELHSRWLEQDSMNLLARAVSRLKELTPAFNHPVPFGTRGLAGGCFWHLCGLAQQAKLEWLQKMVEAEAEEKISL